MHFTVSRMGEGAARRPCMAASESGSGGVMPTVISKMVPERVRRRTVPRT